MLKLWVFFRCALLFFWTPKLYVNIYSHDCKWEGFTHTPALYRGHRVLKHALFGSNVISLEVTFFDISFDLIFDDKFYFWKFQPNLICSAKMPEGPELHLASLYVNRMCEGVLFRGPVIKSEVSKNPDVPFTSEAYCITAASRGKEVKLTLTPIKTDEPKQRVKAGQVEHPMDIVFRFGMSGYFRFTSEDELPKHAHLRFYSKEKPCRVLSFVDPRRFGSWEPNGTWQPGRGPCVMFEYKKFRLVMLSVTCVFCLNAIQ